MFTYFEKIKKILKLHYCHHSQDLEAMMTLTSDLNTDQGFPAGTRPFFYHEVIDRNDGAVTVQEYYALG